MINVLAPTPSGVPDAPIRTGAPSHSGGTIHPVDPAAAARLRALIAEQEARRPRRQKKTPNDRGDIIANLVVRQKELQAMRQRKIDDDTLRALHARYASEKAATAVALADEAGVSATTLIDGWRRLDLPIRGRNGRLRPEVSADAESAASYPAGGWYDSLQPEMEQERAAAYRRGLAHEPSDSASRNAEPVVVALKEDGSEPVVALTRDDIERTRAANDKWFDQLQRQLEEERDAAERGAIGRELNDDDLRATDTGADWPALAGGNEGDLPFVSDPRRLNEIWAQANGHGQAVAPTLGELLEPPVAAMAGWFGRMRALREELQAMGVTVEGTIRVSIDL